MEVVVNSLCSDVTAELLEQALDDTRKQIDLLCKMECHRPFTVNVDDYRDLTAAFRANVEARSNRQENSSGPVSITCTMRDDFQTVSSKRILNGDMGLVTSPYFSSPSPPSS